MLAVGACYPILAAACSFDAAYDDTVGQEAFFQQEVGSQLSGCMKGRSLTLLAYGPTGSGKATPDVTSTHARAHTHALAHTTYARAHARTNARTHT